jgi:hypothetical protein
MIFGIQDPWVAAAYLLSIAASLLCVVYGVVNWNKGDEPVKPEDVKWAKEEKEEIESAL